MIEMLDSRNSGASYELTRRTAMIRPNSPIALPKISMMRILTKR